MKKIILFFCVLFQTLYAQLDGIEIGKSVESLDSTKISNKIGASSDENIYLDYSNFTFYGVKPSSAKISFYKNRLYGFDMKFPSDKWEIFEPKLKEKFGNTWSGKIEKTGSYWGDTKATSVKMSIENDELIVSYSDNTQKDLTFTDFLNPIILYPILAIIGLFVVWFLFAWLYTSRCPKCKSFSLELQSGVELGANVDYNTSISPLSTPEYYHDKTYTYKCKKCGYTHKEKHSGWWQWYNNRNK